MAVKSEKKMIEPPSDGGAGGHAHPAAIGQLQFGMAGGVHGAADLARR